MISPTGQVLLFPHSHGDAPALEHVLTTLREESTLNPVEWSALLSRVPALQDVLIQLRGPKVLFGDAAAEAGNQVPLLTNFYCV